MTILHASSNQEFINQALAIFNKVLQSSTNPIHISLAGGTSPIPFYEKLETQLINWTQVHLWWSDERYVPLDDAQSNFYQAKKAFLDKIKIPPENIHNYDTTLTPKLAAQNYQHLIQGKLGISPSFDLVLLGIGDDGHTASLFPNTPEGQNEVSELILTIYNSPKPPPTRLTFTLPLINQAKNILVFVNGQSRVKFFNQYQSNPLPTLPFTHIKSNTGNTYWLLAN